MNHYFSFSLYICKNRLDPDQTRMEFRKECFVNLKSCACGSKCTKRRTKDDAHNKMVFSMSQYVYMLAGPMRRSSGGSGGPDPPPP